MRGAWGWGLLLVIVAALTLMPAAAAPARADDGSDPEAGAAVTGEQDVIDGVVAVPDTPSPDTAGGQPGMLPAQAQQATSEPPAVPAGAPLVNGRFFPAGDDGSGYAVLDEPNGPPFWSAYQRLGGASVLGVPLSRSFQLPDARIYQATQYALLVWRPGAAAAGRADVLDMMAAAGLDDWLLAQGVPRAARPLVTLAIAPSQSLERLAWLTDAGIRDAYFGESAAPAGTELPVPDSLARFGLPASRPELFEGHLTQRFQRGALRVASPAATLATNVAAPSVVPVPVGELLRDSGMLTPAALAPDRVVGGLLVGRAPRPQLTWPSEVGWGIPDAAAPPPVATATLASGPADVLTLPAATGTPTPASVVAAPTLPSLRRDPTSTPRPAATPVPTARPAAAAQPGARVTIRDVVNQGRAEYVVIANDGTAPQELTGWTLRSATGGQTYTFPDGFVLGAGAVVNVHSGSGDPTVLNRPPTDLYATRSNIWNNAGDVAQIVDPSGRIVAEKRYGAP